MPKNETSPASLAIELHGDIGPITFYRDRYGKTVSFQKTVTEKPGTERQLANRARFRAAQQSWAALSADHREQLELATGKAGLCATGQNLYISYAMRPDSAGWTALMHFTHSTVPEPPHV
jgi:hypothetical protein